MNALATALQQRRHNGVYAGASLGTILGEAPNGRQYIRWLARRPSDHALVLVTDLEAAAAYVVADAFGWLDDDEHDQCVDLAEALAALHAIAQAEAEAA